MNGSEVKRLEKVEEKVTDVYKKVDHIEKSVDDIKGNHLPHIYERLGNNDGKLKVLNQFIAGASIGIVVAIILLVLDIVYFGG